MAYEVQKAANLGSGGHELRFRVKPATTAEINTIIAAQITAAPIPTETGFTMDFKPHCADAPTCEISFSRLPVGATVELLAAPKDPFSEPAVVATRSGESARFETKEVRSAERIRVIASDATSREATYKIWNKAGLMVRLGTEIVVSSDGVGQIASAADTLKGRMHDRVAFFKGPAKGLQYQVARTQNVTGGYMSEYVEPDLRLEQEASTYAYSLLGAMVTDNAGKTEMVVPISARVNVLDNYTREQQSPEYIATHEKISIRLPAGFSARPQLFECLDYSSGTCGKTRFIAADISTEEQVITLHPREAQISGLWLLRADITGGKFEKPGLWTRFTFGLAHYHTFGKYPRWAFWFWFSVIVGSLVGAIIAFVWLGKRKRRWAEELHLKKIESDAVADLLKRDPDFNIEAFKARGRQIAEKIQHAWCAGDMRACRRFLSQGVYNRFRLQLKIMREIEGNKNIMADFKILGFHLWNHNRSGSFDCLTVRLNAEARDTTVNADLSDAESHKQVKAAPLTAFTEFYSFMRRRDAHSANHEKTDQCSHCGTPFQNEGEITKCKSCGAVAGSGTFDWVLTEITQAVEYKGNTTRKGMGEVSSDRLEDRASFVFWRDLMARMTAKRAYIERDATDEYLQAMVLEKQQPLFNVAVGAADLETFKDAEDLSRARIRVKWSAAASRAAEVRHRQSLITLICPTKTAAAGGFAEHSCTSCGAPLPETDSTECSYCHSPIQGKNADWLLETVETTIE